MCTLIAKYFKDYGWVAAKNRDQNYIPHIKFINKKSKTNRILLMYDEETGYREGTNSDGLCIMSTSLARSYSEEKDLKDGQSIEKALEIGKPEEAGKFLISKKIQGHILIFNKDIMYKIEAFHNPESGEYEHTLRKVSRGEPLACTNHGITFEDAGFRDDDGPQEELRRESSESRRKYAMEVAEKAKTPMDLIDGLSKRFNKDDFLNIFRTATKPRLMRTVFQMMLIPSKNGCCIRPVQSKLTINKTEDHFKFEVLSNDPLAKTFKHSYKKFSTLEPKDNGKELCYECETTILQFKRFI